MAHGKSASVQEVRRPAAVTEAGDPQARSIGDGRPIRGLECHGVTFTRGTAGGGIDLEILRSVSAIFRSGEVSLITGETGAGKSTLLHILGGLLRPSQGEVLADGEAVSRWVTSHRDLWRRRVGIVFQQPHLVRDLTVLENVMLPLIPRGLSISEMRNRGIEALERLGVDHLQRNTADSLSGGESQKVSLARAIVSRPHFLIADEPTAHQDGVSARRVLGVFREAAKLHATVVIAAHDPRVLECGLADRRHHLEGGVLREIR